MKKRQGDPFMPPEEYGRSLTGMMLNILVRDMDKAVEFHRKVLDVDVVYSDPDITIVAWQGQQWLIHSDHTYDKHPMYQRIQGVLVRGVGAEFRLHGRDPDEAESAARALGFQAADDAVSAVQAMAESLRTVSAERIQVELDKLVCGAHIGKGYIYSAMGFSLFVEMLNLWAGKKRKHRVVQLNQPTMPEETTG